ncbi:unnamed protein product [Notodromas monacha]|uniref:A to I editase domain-containing protein n=1 Tax=Notodromas monacha TaxID=399045 RepID=A0A7R9BR96_9CRUS|nr:unnamed protein product [Notodromas monacha]CAG0918859.1 unnamed protein product [Notodromas monacha]
MLIRSVESAAEEVLDSGNGEDSVNKKAAKAAASRVASCAFHPEIRISPTTGDCFLTNPRNMDSTIDFSSDDIDMLTFTENFSDTRMCVRDKFVELTTGNEIASKKKILAGFVMTENLNPATARVIAVATGTKCISGGELSIDGNSVQDCHAKIIAKRGVRLFFIEQMKASLDLRESIFTHLPDGRFQLHPGIHFHLFVSSATCGDARIYCLQETVGNFCPASKVRNAGVLRTKIESGEGTIPVQGNSQQTFDAIVGSSVADVVFGQSLPMERNRLEGFHFAGESVQI